MYLLQTILDAFVQFGYIIVFIGVLLENMGIPLPGETILLAADLFAAQGYFNLWAVTGLGALGAICGDNLGFWLGHKLGHLTLDRYGRILWLTPARLRLLEAFFAHHGEVTLIVARFVSVLRVTVALFAGISRMPWRRFLLFNAGGVCCGRLSFRWWDGPLARAGTSSTAGWDGEAAWS